MIIPEVSLPHLRGLIGRCVDHQGSALHVIEVLEDGPSLVLQGGAHDTEIQDNQYGEPQRRVPRTYTVPVLQADRQPHPDFLALTLAACD